MNRNRKIFCDSTLNLMQCYYEIFLSGFMGSDLSYLDVLEHTSTVWSMKRLEDRSSLYFSRAMMLLISVCCIFHWAGCR